MLSAGQTVERYRVVRFIGEGGMGQVFLVEHEHLHQYFALKLINRSHPEIVRRARLEAQTQASLKHPNIVGLSDFLMLGPSPCMIMEYVEGVTLHEWISHHFGAPPLDQAELLFRGILAGVETAHQRGLVHRDLKPGNVLLDREGTAKVADFGLVKVMGELARYTTDGTVVGTPGYMAPEQGRGATTVDKRTDVYALGCIFYEMLTGQPLFSSSSLKSALAEQQAPLAAVAEALPLHLSEAVLRCLEQDPADRPADATALREILGWSPGPVIGGVPIREPEATRSHISNETYAPPRGGGTVAGGTGVPPDSQVNKGADVRFIWAVSGAFVATLGLLAGAWFVSARLSVAPPLPAPVVASPNVTPLLGYRPIADELVYAFGAAPGGPWGEGVAVGWAPGPARSVALQPGLELVSGYEVEWFTVVERHDVPEVLLPLAEPPVIDAPDRFACGFDGLPACTRGRPPPPPTPQGAGTLDLRTWPYARISVDGREIGRKTPAAFEVPSGVRRVRLTDKDGAVRELDLKVLPNTTTRYCWSFEDNDEC